MLGLLGPRETVDISCDVDIEQTPESFHAYAIPMGIEIREGDIVIVHDAPTNVGFGEHVTMKCRATVQRANLADRMWTRFTSLLELTELYEVGFSARERP
jgi:hypothetical protein